jgi:hypothetical protein
MVNLLMLLLFRIYKVHDSAKDKHFELELGWVSNDTDRKFVRITGQQLADAITAAEAAVKSAKEDEDDDDDDDSDDDDEDEAGGDE